MLELDRLLDDFDESASEERAAVLYALIENQQAIITEELQQYRQRCVKLFETARRLAAATSLESVLSEDWAALKSAVDASAQDFPEE